MFCPNCGAKNDDGALFCQKCGARLTAHAPRHAGGSHLDSDGNGVPDALESPTVLMSGQQPTTVMGAAPTTVLPPREPNPELDATRVAPRTASQQPRYQHAPAPAPAPAPRKRSNKGLIAGILALVVIGCGVFGYIQWSNYQAEIEAAEQARIEQEEAERKAAEEARALEEKRQPHDVVLPLSAEGLDSSGTRIAVRYSGTDFEGNAIDETGYIEADGTGISLPKGAYEVVILASPIAGDGTLYEIPESPFPFEIPEDQENGSVFNAPGTLVLIPYGPGTAPEGVLDQAIAYAKADPAISEDLVNTLAEKANAATSEAAHDEAVKRAQADGLTVVTGTLHVMTGSELCSYQGYEFSQVFGTGSWADEEAKRIYVIIEFAHETSLDAMSADGSGIRTDTAIMLGITNQDRTAWDAYEGQQVTVAYKPAETMWPTDVSLPMGQPRTRNVRVID